MTKSDFIFILKRIIIGICVAYVLMLLQASLFFNVSALEIYSHDFGGSIDVISNTNYQTYYNTNNYWSDWGNGYVHFAFSVMKNAGQNSVSAIVQPRSTFVSTGSSSFICDIGSVNSQNSTYNDQVYSATCPVSFVDGNGLRAIYINFSDIQANDSSTYRVTFDGKVTFEKPSAYPSFNSSGIINNQNSNNQALINNQNTNTQSIINNQNANTQKEIDAQKVCKTYDVNNATINGYLDPSGTFVSPSSDKNVTDYIGIDNSSIKVLSIDTTYANPSACFYNSNKVLISCIRNNSMSVNSELTIPSGASYVRFTINTDLKKPTFQICQNGNSAIINSQQEINNTLNNDNVDDASSVGSSFFSDFSADSHGLSGIITSPLRLVQSLTSSTCNSLTIPLPFVNQSASIPCMSSVYSLYPSFYTLWQLITTGLISYWICIKIFGHVKGMQTPNDDKIEVVNL